MIAPPARAEPPLAPRDLYAEAARPDQVTLSWRPGAELVSGTDPGERYQVFRDGELVADTADTKVVDIWLSELRTYNYVVRAIRPGGASSQSEPLAIRTPAFTAGLEIGPYLQQLSPDRVAIVWQTYVPATTSLHFGAAGAPLVNVERDSNLTRDHVVVVKDLVPGQRYAYRWESDGRLGDPAELVTPPVGPASFSFGVIGDFGVPTPAARANLRRLVRDDVDLALTTGDNAQVYGNEEEYRNWVLRPLMQFVTTRPLWPSVGNHDYYGLDSYRRYFALPNNELHYSFDYGGVFFLALDSNRFDARQRRWARAELRRSSASCKVAFFHHPLWSSGRGYRSHTRKHRRQRFVPLLQRGGVDLVLTGHVQGYERTKPLRSGRVSRRRGIVHVVTGGGGARLTPFATRRKPRWSARRGRFHHRMRFTVSKRVLRGKAIDTGGRTRDRFKVRCR